MVKMCVINRKTNLIIKIINVNGLEALIFFKYELIEIRQELAVETWKVSQHKILV